MDNWHLLLTGQVGPRNLGPKVYWRPTWTARVSWYERKTHNALDMNAQRTENLKIPVLHSSPILTAASLFGIFLQQAVFRSCLLVWPPYQKTIPKNCGWCMEISGNETLIGSLIWSEPDMIIFDHTGNCLGICRTLPKNDGTINAQEQKKTRKSRINSDRYQLNLIIYTKSLITHLSIIVAAWYCKIICICWANKKRI